MEERNNRLIVAYFDKTIDDDGLAELKEWLESSPENQDIFSETIHILSASKAYFVQPEQQGSNWARIQAHIAAEQKPSGEAGQPAEPTIVQPQRARFTLNRWFIAAVFLLMISAAAFFGYQQLSVKQATPIQFAQFNNPNGSHSKIFLPDGSVIHLGAGSKIRYEKNFTGKKRLIDLDGEAFFEVAHEAQRPFIVRSGKVSAVVLGTSFNVKAFALSNKVSVTVNTGKVGVVSQLRGKGKIVSYLLPDEQLEVNTQTGELKSTQANAAAVSGWMNNNFVYYNTSLKDIAASLQRHYGITISFANPASAQIKLTAKFNNLPIHQVADNLAQLSGLSFNRKGNEISIADHDQKRRGKMK